MQNTAVITGGSSGIGLELARVFAERGHDLVLIARDGDRLNEIGEELAIDFNREVKIFARDLTEDGAVEDIVEQMKAVDDIRALVNDAGVGTYGLFLETPWDQMDYMIRLNVMALTKLTWMLTPRMLGRGEGYILNMGSVASFQPGPLMAVYYATKAYVLSFSEALRYELKDTDISVTCLCPPQTETRFDERAGMEHSKAFSDKESIMDAREVALAGYDALMKKDDIIVPGMKTKFQSLMPRFMPARAATAASKKQLEPADAHRDPLK